MCQTSMIIIIIGSYNDACEMPVKSENADVTEEDAHGPWVLEIMCSSLFTFYPFFGLIIHFL